MDNPLIRFQAPSSSASHLEASRIRASAPYSDAEGTLIDPSLSDLRNQIKNTMMPLLITVFELKNGSQMLPPSRLYNRAEVPLDEIREQLENLGKDLNLLSLWVQGAQRQVEKALQETRPYD